MIISSILNPITFKDLSDGEQDPRNDNTLHNDSRVGGFMVQSYYQPFKKDETVPLIFSSDVDTDLTLKAYNPILISTTVKSFATSYAGDYPRYYFYFPVTLGADYYDKQAYFTIEQGSDLWTSEPICVKDYTDEIARRELLRIKYTNLDKVDSDISNRFVDWTAIDNTGNYMQFYIEAVNFRSDDEEEIEILDGSIKKTVISYTSFLGIKVSTGYIPVYMARKLMECSPLDVFEVNGKQYIRKGYEQSELDGNKFVSVVLSLTEKTVLGMNVDDLGIENEEDMAWHTETITEEASSNFNINYPQGYIASNIFVKHTSSSLATSNTVTAGFSNGSDELGSVMCFKSSTRPTAMQPNQIPSFDADGRIYFTIEGDAGVILKISVLFQLMPETIDD